MFNYIHQRKILQAFNPVTLTITVKPQIYDRALEGNNIIDHSDVVGESPVGTAPTTYSF